MMYKVFEVDKCFREYETDDVLVGAESVEDVLNHFGEIFPSTDEVVKREDWMDDDDWECETEGGKYADGDVRTVPYFTDDEMDAFRESLDPGNFWPRIKLLPHLFTDTPYKVLTGYGYIE